MKRIKSLVPETDRNINLMFLQNRDELMLVLSLQGQEPKQIQLELDRLRRRKARKPLDLQPMLRTEIAIV